MNHLLPSHQGRFSIRSWNAARSAAEWANGATLDHDDESNLALRGGIEAFRFEQVATPSSLACAVRALARFGQAMEAQVQIQSMPSAWSERLATEPLLEVNFEVQHH